MYDLSMDEPLDDEQVYSTWPDGGPAWKLCQCSICGTVKRCCPSFDFYKKLNDPSKRLFCERCLLASEDYDDIILFDTKDFVDPKEDDPADWWKDEDNG